MTPLTSLGLTPGWPQPGASSAAPEQPGLFDLVLTLQQQVSGTGPLQRAAADVPVTLSPTVSPLAHSAPGQVPTLPVGVPPVFSVPATSVICADDGSGDEVATARVSVGSNEPTPAPAVASDNNTPEMAASTPDARPINPSVAQTVAAFAKMSAPVDDRTEPERKTSDESPNETAAMSPMAQIWALVSGARNEVQTGGKDEASDGALSERDPAPGGPVAFLSGKGAKLTTDPTKLPVNDARRDKDVREFVDTLLDALPAPVSQGRDQTSLSAQQPLLVRNEHAGVAQPQSVLDIDTKQLDLLMRDISELTSTAGKAAFHLSSEHLGRLQVHLETTEVGVSVAIRTDNERGHVAVSQAQKQLQDDLHANGLKVAETSVALGQNGAEQQRSDRNAHVRIAPKIEAAIERSSEPDENQTDRPDGRFA